jgi:hypothetical protein
MSIQSIPNTSNAHDLEIFKLGTDQILQQLVFPEDLMHVTILKSNYFDPSLWRELMQLGALKHHTCLLVEKITAGHLWVQYGLEGAIIHWSRGETIFRASLFEEKALVVSYAIEKGAAQTTRTSIEASTLRQLLHIYLKNEVGKHPTPEHPKWNFFLKQLELVQIVCKISASASEKMNELSKVYANKKLNLSISFLIKATNRTGYIGYVIMKVSNQTLFDCASRATKKIDQVAVQTIGPTLRSYEALDQLENGIQSSDATREVLNLSNRQRSRVDVEDVRMERLKPCLLIEWDRNSQHFSFKMNPDMNQDRKSGFELSIDYIGDAWSLQSTYVKG